MKKNPSDFYKLIGSKIKELRKSSGLNVEDLNEKSGLKLSKASLSAIENGKQKISAHQLYYIGKGLGVSVDIFFEEIKNNEKQEDLEKIKNI